MLHRATPFLVGLLGLTAVAGRAQQLNTAKLDSLLMALATSNKMMGSLTLSKGGQVVYSRAISNAQLGPDAAATRYRVGSIIKMFTAAMIFQLIEEKKLTLATPLATFFPQLPNAASITVDHLLSHRSSLHDFASDGPDLGRKTQAELLAIIGKVQPDAAPGAKFAYSNSNYVVLGYIVEKLTKMLYAQALQKRVVARAGLQNTYYGGKIDPAKHEAFAYERSGNTWQQGPETNMSVPGGAGALVSTPADLARFLEALFGSQLISAASLREMKTVRDGFGRSLMQLLFNDHLGYGHGGTIDDFRARASYFPNEKLALALCSNSGPRSIDDALVGVLGIYFGRPYKIPDFAPSTYLPTMTELDRYAGLYASAQFPFKITVTHEGPGL